MAETVGAVVAHRACRHVSCSLLTNQLTSMVWVLLCLVRHRPCLVQHASNLQHASCVWGKTGSTCSCMCVCVVALVVL